MTPEQIRAAIAARPDLSGVTDSQALADALSVGRVAARPRPMTEGDLAEALGDIVAEALLVKLEAARDTLLAATQGQRKLAGSLLRRRLLALAGRGLDMGRDGVRGMWNRLEGFGAITKDEAAQLSNLAVEPDQLSEMDVRRAIYADNGDLLI